MSSGASSLTGWSFALAGLVYFGFTLQLLLLGYARSPRSGSQWAILLAVAFCSLWGWLGLAYLYTDRHWLLSASMLADLLRYASWIVFLLQLFRLGAQTLPGAVRSMAGGAFALIAVGLLAQGLAALGTDALGDPGRWVLLSSMGISVYALILVEQIYRNVAEDSRWNVKPLCLGLAGAFAFDVYLYSQSVLFNRLDGDALSIRGGVHSLVAPLLLLSMTRRKDWLEKIHISRQVAFHSATLLIAGAYLLFISAVGYYVRYFGGDWGRALQLGLIFFALVLMGALAMSGSVRAKLRVYVGKNFFRYRYDYREEWLKFTQALASGNSPQEMGHKVVRGLADMLESPGGGLWLKSGVEPAFEQVALWNIPHTAEKESPSSPLCKFLSESGWVINLEEYRSYPRRYGALTLPAWVHEIPKAWLMVPLIARDELIGFVVLVGARTYVDVNWEVNDLLKTAGRQAASFLSQMQATEALLEARKFDAFNRMSAFVVHDLKNIVTQLSLMLKNAQRLRNNPEFQQDMLMTVENSLDRMRQLMLQLREGATPAGTVHGVDLEAIVRRIETLESGRGRTLEVTVVDKVTTRGHQDRLERVIGHVVQNAFDATDASGRVWLRLDRFGSQARIEVEDTGQGMSEEFIRDRLFKPFQTTKQAGMGIGAYESFQYVQELGGKMLVDSEVNKGTRVTIVLPVFEVHKESDLHKAPIP